MATTADIKAGLVAFCNYWIDENGGLGYPYAGQVPDPARVSGGAGGVDGNR